MHNDECCMKLTTILFYMVVSFLIGERMWTGKGWWI